MPNKSNRKKPRSLFAAIMARDVERVRELLDAGANVNEQDGANPMTPLHWAAHNDQTAIVDLLLSRGANIEAQTKGGWTPLHYAAAEASAATVKSLLRRGADVRARTDDGSTPLHLAASIGHIANVELLIEAGADLDAKDNHKRTPLYYAAKKIRMRMRLQ